MNSIYEIRILVVDDNTDLLRLLQEQLTDAGYRHIQTVRSCAEAKRTFAADIPQLMILDINLPDGDGFSLFRALRGKADIPALFLSARDADADRLFGLGLGADDYLTKPFLMQELLLRVQHILQRAYRAELSLGRNKTVTLGACRTDLQDALVTWPDGRAFPSPPQNWRCCASWLKTAAILSPTMHCANPSGVPIITDMKTVWASTSAICGKRSKKIPDNPNSFSPFEASAYKLAKEESA